MDTIIITDGRVTCPFCKLSFRVSLNRNATSAKVQCNCEKTFTVKPQPKEEQTP